MIENYVSEFAANSRKVERLPRVTDPKLAHLMESVQDIQKCLKNMFFDVA